MGDYTDFAVEQKFFAVTAQHWQPKYERIVRMIEPEFVQAEPYKWYLTKFRDYLRDHHKPLPWEYVDILIHREFEDPDALEEMRKAIYLLYAQTANDWGDQAVTDFRQYLAWRVHSAGFTASRDGFRKSKDMRLALDQSQRAMDSALSILVEAEAHDLAADFEAREAEWTRERDFPGIRNRLHLGISGLDDQMKLQEGTVTAVLGVFKRYKSIMLNHCGIAALVSGFNVAHVTYENTLELTEDRYFSRLGAIPFDDMTTMRVEEADPARYKQARAFLQGLNTHLGNRLKIIEAVPKQTTVADIEAQLDVMRVEDGFIPDVTIWDYANLIGRPHAMRFEDREERQKQENIIWDLQNHAKDTRNGGARRKIVLTAVQAKAEAIKKEKLDAGDFGKSIGIPQALDCLFGINQTKQEQNDGLLRFSVLASRNSKVGDEVEVECDMSWMCVDLSSQEWIADRAVQLFMQRAAS